MTMSEDVSAQASREFEEAWTRLHVSRLVDDDDGQHGAPSRISSSEISRST
jgi:hypothetical protein